MRIVKQIQFKNLGELHKVWTEAGVKASIEAVIKAKGAPTKY